MTIITYLLGENKETKDIIDGIASRGYIKLLRTTKMFPNTTSPLECIYEFNPMFDKHFGQKYMVRIKPINKQGEHYTNLWARLNWWEHQKLQWITNEHWILKDKRYQWIIGMSVSFAGGFITKWIWGC